MSGFVFDFSASAFFLDFGNEGFDFDWLTSIG